MRYTLKCSFCNIRNIITNDEIKNNLYICPICHTKYKISVNEDKELEYRIIND